jgi:hypothetical protein
MVKQRWMTYDVLEFLGLEVIILSRRSRWLLLAAVAVLLLIVQSVTAFTSGWQHSAAKMAAVGEGALGWDPAWLVPLASGFDQATQLLSQALVEQLQMAGVNARLAPVRAEFAQGEPLPTLLFLSVGEWRSSWRPLGRGLHISLSLRSQKLNAPCYGSVHDGLWMAQTLEGSGKYTGLVRTTAASRDAANLAAKKLVSGVLEELAKHGLVAPQPPHPEQSAAKWSFGLELSQGSTEPKQTVADDGLLLLGERPDYSWTVNTVRGKQIVSIYQTQATGDELEAALIREFPKLASGQSFESVHHVNGLNRRILGDGLMAHWIAAAEAQPVDSPDYSEFQDQILSRYAMVINSIGGGSVQLKDSGIAEYLDYRFDNQSMYIAGLKVFEEFSDRNEGSVRLDGNILTFSLTKSTGTVTGALDGPNVQFTMNIDTNEILEKAFRPAPNYIKLGLQQFAEHSEEVLALTDERMLEIGQYFVELFAEIEANH